MQRRGTILLIASSQSAGEIHVPDSIEQTIQVKTAAPVLRRVAHYRQWAAEAEARASEATSGEVRDAYHSLARSWLQMAADGERQVRSRLR